MNNKMFDLSGKVALVTGASRGIGESIARTLAASGAHVIVSSRNIDGCQFVAERIREGGGSAEAFACHIGEMDQLEAVWKHIAATHGKLDILVNNAATNPYFGPVEDTDLGAFQKTVDVNIRGYYFMCARAVQLMKTHGGGAIVNVASVNGVVPGHFQGIYSITKAAVMAMTKSFAKELGAQNIRVNALLPGLTDTRFARALTSNEAIKKQALQHIPMNRVAAPDEMAGTVLYLVSAASTYTTGTCINVDGGYLTV
ncbi:SDR family oxidoreductase [Marinobacter sp. X15-166B]|uniref:SDR family oxidoreductase n=1 Tax=Marinobacter sp. X15-166B TaxID=1897620 RepID=UPI00085CAB80|nr:SDR family oxidoreductase [Marinobacter sp. X15-166B]OEY66935.1 short-chain dehydrogenase [Marinobacter sp. X15-166B]